LSSKCGNTYTPFALFTPKKYYNSIKNKNWIAIGYPLNIRY